MMRYAVRASVAAVTAMTLSATALAAFGGSPATSRQRMPLTPGAAGAITILQASIRTAPTQVMQPAPVPDAGITAPEAGGDALAAERSPSIEPYLFNPRNHFAGDGYAPGSSLENAQNNRETPAGGMNVLIPVR